MICDIHFYLGVYRSPAQKGDERLGRLEMAACDPAPKYLNPQANAEVCYDQPVWGSRSGGIISDILLIYRLDWPRMLILLLILNLKSEGNYSIHFNAIITTTQRQFLDV